jgi:prepilin-type N-terminal cleavage/methylation domain-containing protein
MQAGFTLVEIAIVLVIVGLLLGAVLKGQELIFNSKVKATYNMSKEFAAAVNGYQDRYKQLPGDDSGAAARFPTANPVPTNGNSDGFIWGGGVCAAANTGEHCQALAHLRAAGFVSGNGAEAARTSFGGEASIHSMQQLFAGTGSTPALGLRANTLSAKAAVAIDTAWDDGNPSTGIFRCQNTASYNMAQLESNMPGWCAIRM